MTPICTVLPTIHPGMRWARFEFSGQPPGPWFATAQRARDLMTGKPQPGDVVVVGIQGERYVYRPEGT